jgi:threonine dehydrogenase-like Zn-dependent dehydrogenase
MRMRAAKGHEVLVRLVACGEWILEQTDGFGADYTFEATGHVQLMRQAVESARTNWRSTRSTAAWS